MTKGELIKALQDAPFGDDVTITVVCAVTNVDVVVGSYSTEIWKEHPIRVDDENELHLLLMPDNLSTVICRNELLYKK